MHLPWTGRNRGVDPAGRVKANGSGNSPAAVSGRGPVALRYRDFRNLFAASFVSLIGTQMQQVALTWQLYELTESPFALGLIGRSHAAAAQILGSPFVAIVMLMFTITSAYHMWLGMQVIIEDYVHSDFKLTLIMLNTFFCFAVGMSCVYAIVKLSFGV